MRKTLATITKIFYISLKKIHIISITYNSFMILPTQQQKQASLWFKELRHHICQAFEAIEYEYHQTQILGKASDQPPLPHAPQFSYTPWARQENDKKGDFGGGEMGVLKGRVFEKVGVNISTVYGQFDEHFRKEIPGASDNHGHFWASGISLVAHMHSPFVPAVHMNARMICTSETWFGGGTDLNTANPDADETQKFHKALQECCDTHDADYYQHYKKWCDEYFYVKHRHRARGEGGIFYDRLQSGNWDKDFAFTKDVGQCFLTIYPQLVRQKMHQPYTEDDRKKLYEYRGLYAEFNLLYDRGTRFGLMTNGNVDAILMSLPPIATWS